MSDIVEQLRNALSGSVTLHPAVNVRVIAVATLEEAITEIEHLRQTTGKAVERLHIRNEAMMKAGDMTVHDAEPGDVYVDDSGKLWRCIAVHNEPTLVFEEVEPRSPAGKSTMQAPARPGLWAGSKRIWRKKESAAAHAKTSSGPVNCSIRKWFQNETYPRTCERCGLGPCPFFNNDGTRRVT